MNACDSGTVSRWREAEQALRIIVPAVCHASAEGSTLYVFSSQYEVVPGLKTVGDVDRVFKQQSPAGTTNLRPVLAALTAAHRQSYARDGRPTSVLVIHDGEPNEPDAVRQLLAETANGVSSDYELFFSFIQCGQDDGAQGAFSCRWACPLRRFCCSVGKQGLWGRPRQMERATLQCLTYPPGPTPQCPQIHHLPGHTSVPLPLPCAREWR
jgi:hypothetical protein